MPALAPESGGPDASQPAGPILDKKTRWRLGWTACGLAIIATAVAFFRPLAPGAPLALRAGYAMALGLGLGGVALLASLRGRGRGEQYALYAFLALACDGFAQILGHGWPSWPLLALLVASTAVAETLPVALSVATLASVLAFAEQHASWRGALATSLGWLAIALAVNRALAVEKRRLAAALGELARLKHGIEQLDEDDGITVPTPAVTALRQVSEDSRRQRQVDHAEELERTLDSIASLAQGSVGAHSVLYLEVDRAREVAFVRAAAGPENLLEDANIALTQDPVAFVIDRKSAFYATDYKRLLWNLPYYKGEVRIGTLLAVPVRVSEVVSGILLADKLEVQALAGKEPALLEGFAALAADEISRARGAAQREELGTELKAVYDVSTRMAALVDAAAVRQRLLQSACDLAPVEGGAIVLCDEEQTRYHVEDAVGWAGDLMGREVAISERTWAAWALRSGEDAFLLDDVASQDDRMPFLVLDEEATRNGSLLVRILKARNRTLGALVLTGRKGAFDGGVNRVLGILAGQAGATLSVIQLKERHKELAVRDGLTGLYNRRAFGELLAQAIAREDRQGGGMALFLLDLDHFKRLNDSYGHPAGDAALKKAAELLTRHLRRGDLAARYGGEEFVAILPGADGTGATALAERVRAAFEQVELIFEGARLRITASFGVACWPGAGRSPETLLAAADRALYASKQAGRNRVTVADVVETADQSAPPSACESS